MKIKIYLEGETPAKKNSRVTDTRTGRSFPSARYRNWEQEKILEVRRQYQGDPFSGQAFVFLIFYHEDRRSRDSDNQVSSVFDMLKKAKVLKDDRWTLLPLHCVLNELADSAGCDVLIADDARGVDEIIKGLCKR